MRKCKSLNPDLESKFAIIGGDIHVLIKIQDGEDWSNHAWRIQEEDDLYWVPIPNSKMKISEGNWVWMEMDQYLMRTRKHRVWGRDL